MTTQDLKSLQSRLKFDAPSMALSTGIPYHTYRNYYFGANKIPDKAARRFRALERLQNYKDRCRLKNFTEYLDQVYPIGFISEAIEC